MDHLSSSPDSPDMQPPSRCLLAVSSQDSLNFSQISVDFIQPSPTSNLPSVVSVQESPVPTLQPLQSSLFPHGLPALGQISSRDVHRDSDSLHNSLDSNCNRPDSLRSEPLCSSNDGDDISGLEVLQHQGSQEQRLSCPPAENSPGECLELPSPNQQEQKQLHQRLSWSSSLNAKAREFVPKNIPAPSVPLATPAVTPPSIHSPVPPPLRMPHGPSPGGLPMLPPPSPIARTPPQLGMFPPSGIGPPPPPIPGCVTNPMQMLGPHPGLLNMQLQRPSQPSILPPTFMIPSPPFGVAVHPLSSHMLDSHVTQPFGVNVQSVQDGDQPHDLNSGSIPASTAKPVLTEDLKAKIIKQVEFYFSDCNLPTDNYLMKFVRKDPEGFVPISVVAMFRKTRNLVKSNALLATTLRSSEHLVVSDDGKKVRRVHPLLDVDLEDVQSRTVVAENLPEDHSICSMEKLFQSVGNVKMVRICQPEAVNGANQTSAKFIKTDMVVSNKLHALIEYESVEQAERAVSELTDHRNWRSGLHVRLLLRRTFQSKHGHQQVACGRGRKSNDGGDGSGGEEDTIPLLSDAILEKVGVESVDSAERFEGFVGNDNVYSEKDGGLKKGRGRGRGRSKGHGHFHQNGGRSHPLVTPPHANIVANSETKLPPGPRMPDGTRGFSAGRGKLIANTLT